MEQLLFGNPVFTYYQLNVTVRRGDKWFNKYHNDNLREVELADPTGYVYGKAQLVTCELNNFIYLPQEWLDLEHDPSCQTLAGLYNGMLAAYPDFKADEDVSILFFVPVPTKQVIESSLRDTLSTNI
jgi:hypothetical protein